MKKISSAKIRIAMAGGLVLAGFMTPAAHAATITPNLAPGGGFDWTYSDRSSGSQSQVSGDLFITSSSFGPASVISGGLAPVPGGNPPKHPMPPIPAPPVPDNGSTAALLGLALFGLVAFRRRLIAA
jgi:hypothetical protein